MLDQSGIQPCPIPPGNHVSKCDGGGIRSFGPNHSEPIYHAMDVCVCGNGSLSESKDDNRTSGFPAYKGKRNQLLLRIRDSTVVLADKSHRGPMEAASLRLPEPSVLNQPADFTGSRFSKCHRGRVSSQ